MFHQFSLYFSATMAATENKVYYYYYQTDTAMHVLDPTKMHAPPPVLVNLESVAQENEFTVATRDIHVGCVRTMAVSQKKVFHTVTHWSLYCPLQLTQSHYQLVRVKWAMWESLPMTTTSCTNCGCLSSVGHGM